MKTLTYLILLTVLLLTPLSWYVSGHTPRFSFTFSTLALADEEDEDEHENEDEDEDEDEEDDVEDGV